MQRQSRLSDYFFAVPLTGDIALFLGMFRPTDWTPKTNVQQFAKLISSICLIYLIFFSFPLRVIFRYAHGVYTIGWVIAAMTGLNILFFNLDITEDQLPNYLSPIVCFIFLFSLGYDIIIGASYDTSPDVVNLLSPAMGLFFWVFGILVIIHIIVSYFTVQKDARDFKRGTPIIWKIARRFSRKLRGKEDLYIWALLESVLAGGGGAYLYFSGQDKAFGMFLIMAALSYFLLESYEVLMKSARLPYKA